MAQAAEVNQQLWDETINRLLSLSTSTLKRNAELEARLAHLELELSVWKGAHAAALETVDRESAAHNVRMATLNRQVAELENMNSQTPLILCVVDGDEHVFDDAYLVQGQHGGRLAGQQLTKGIAEYLAQEDVQIASRVSFWTSVYFNRRALCDTLVMRQVCTADQFDAFLVGFSQASPRFLLVDVGYGKEAADAKIKEYLMTFIRFPQTLRIFLGGNLDNGYIPMLNALENEQLLGKLVHLHGCDSSANDDAHLNLPTLHVDGLFMSQRLLSLRRTPPPLGIAGLTSNGGLVSPESPSQSVPPTGPRLIDESRPLHRQSPPPCNEHYLMTCTKGPSCKYSHEYLLTGEQLATLASNAKKAPCNFLKKGLVCPYRERCCWGHECPNGRKCFHFSKGKCWFKGDAMHPIGTDY